MKKVFFLIGLSIPILLSMTFTEAKQFVRDMLKVKRLPNGTTFWL